MAKTDLGTKRLCESCESKFYDLGRTPIECPKCGTPFVEVKPTPRTRKPVEKKPEVETKSEAETEAETEAEAESEDAPATPVSETEDDTDNGAEIVSLEDADEERSGGGDDATGDDTAADGDDIEVADVELDDDSEEDAKDDTFLEDDEDDDSNVSDLVGGVDKGNAD